MDDVLKKLTSKMHVINHVAQLPSDQPDKYLHSPLNLYKYVIDYVYFLFHFIPYNQFQIIRSCYSLFKNFFFNSILFQDSFSNSEFMFKIFI